MRNRLSFHIAGGAILGCLLTACLTMPGLADVRLPAIESDNMVLQAGSASQLFGLAAPGETVTITLGKRTVSATANGSGRWRVSLPKLKAGEKFDIVVAGKNTVTIKNVLVGEVWLCSGQSNMEFGLAQVNDSQRELASANHEQIRLFNVKRCLATTPASDVEGSWKVCDPASAAGFSAVGYFFGRALNQDLNTPVGLIESSWGGTPAQCWTSLKGLEADPVTQGRYWLQAPAQLSHYSEASKAFEKADADWEASADKDKTSRPVKPPELQWPSVPSMLYNSMIAPLTPCTISGVIWYQGESNTRTLDEAVAYRRLFPALIKDWRKQFNRPELPFFYVQLANFGPKEKPNESKYWPELRESQLLTLGLPATGMAVAVDIGDSDNIHPKNKQDVGKRLERIAMAKVYGKKETYSGPIFRRLDVKGSKAICTFDNSDQGLKTRDGGPLSGFVIGAADQKFVRADAVISGNTVVVSSAAVSQPVAVRYAWAGDPPNNLCNGAGLPASPFRSDLPPEPTVVNLPLSK